MHPQNLLAFGLAEVLRKLWGILIEPYLTLRLWSAKVKTSAVLA